MNAPLVLTLGEPAGIGPEIIVKTWRALRESGPAFMVVGDRKLLDEAAGEAIALSVSPSGAKRIADTFKDRLPIIDRPLAHRPRSGEANPANERSVVDWIEHAVRLVQSGEASALVTGPIAKAPLYAAGFGFPGHTEFLGSLAPAVRNSAARGPVMMLAAGGLRVSLVTIHEPLSRVASLLTREAIFNVGRVTGNALHQDFGLANPRLAVAGFNPHAGEGGALGREEEDIIAPAVAMLRQGGIDVKGPLPADTLFHAEARDRFDAIVCLYHDQALIPIKMLDFWGGVNITLGLPIVRTSPDHGVGFDIAGKRLARPDSLIAAIRMAAEIAGRRAPAP